MEAMFICQADLENVVRLTSNFLSKNLRASLVHICMIRFQENQSLFFYITKKVNIGVKNAQKWNVKARVFKD